MGCPSWPPSWVWPLRPEVAWVGSQETWTPAMVLPVMSHVTLGKALILPGLSFFMTGS